MKSPKAFIVALVLISSFPILAQQAGAGVSAQQSASASAAGASANESSSASANAQASAQMRPVSGELVGKLDSKTAKVGDAVVVKTTASVRSAEGLVIPKGSRLVGHVTDVRAHAKGSEDGFLAVQFDRAELKSGQTVAIHSVIESVAPSPSAMATTSAESDDAFPGGAGGLHTSGGGRTVGGLTGGALSTGSSVTGGATGAVGTTTTAAGSGLSSAGNLAGSATADAAGGLQTATSATGGLGAHATAIPGVMLAGDDSGATSGTLSASRKNVHLDSGTQIVLGVAAAANR